MKSLRLENRLKKGYRVRSIRVSSCLALVMQNKDRIIKLRDIEMRWSDIARHLCMSTSSLRQAIRQINALEHCHQETKPKGIRPQLTVYFSSEDDKQDFIDWTRAIKNDVPIDGYGR